MTRQSVIIAAHGSQHEPSVNAQIRALAGRVAAGGEFAQVVAAFNQGAPRFAEVLDQLDVDDVVVVPLMTSEGFFSGEFLRRELRRNRRFHTMQVRITAPVGVHPAMSEIAEATALQALAARHETANDVTLIAVGHGTNRDPISAEATFALAAQLAARGVFGEVLEGFLDQSPSIELAAAAARHDTIMVLPFLIGAGMHAIRDIPRRIGRSDARVAPPLGTDERMVDVIRELALNAPLARNSFCAPPGAGILSRDAGDADRRVLRLGTRSSRLALWQARFVADRLCQLGVTVELIEMDTLGDRNLTVPIAELGSDAPFTGDIELALLDGQIDLAVHSLKDLPLAATEGLTIAAVLKRGDPAESLVSRSGEGLMELPAGACVGTSSPRRAAQVLYYRPDLSVQPIRGPVESRVAQVRSGRFDGAVLAAAGLQRLGMQAEIAETFDVQRFVPAPGQAALAVQTRSDDARTRALAAGLIDEPTTLATQAELAFLRQVTDAGHSAAAAYATVTASGTIEILCRVVTRDGRDLNDVTVSGTSAERAARAAMERLALCEAAV